MLHTLTIITLWTLMTSEGYCYNNLAPWLVVWSHFSSFICLVFMAPQAPAAGPQAEQDGTGTWRGMLKKGEEAPGSGPGSPLRGVVNLLDVVTKHQPISMLHHEDETITERSIKTSSLFFHQACAGCQEAVVTWAAGLWGHRAPYQVLLPHRSQEYSGQVGEFRFCYSIF